jgi:hypothetical protein
VGISSKGVSKGFSSRKKRTCGLVASADEWRWSNYRATAGLASAPSWLAVDWTLAQFGTRRRLALASYRRFVASGTGVPSPLDGVAGQIYLGDERFLKDVNRLARPFDADPEFPMRQRRPGGPSIEDVESAVAVEWGVAPVAFRARRGREGRVAAMFLIRVLTRTKVRDIAERYGVRPGRVSNAVRQVLEGPATDLGRRVSRIEAALRTGEK